MKKIRIIGLLITGIMLTACGSSNNQHGERVPFPDEWLEIADSMDLPIQDFNNALSPNGKWMVDTSWDNAIDGALMNDVYIIPLSNPNTKIEVQNDDFYGNYLFPNGWSPDSSAIAVLGADKGSASCPFTRVIIYKIDPNLDAMTQYVFEPYKKDDDPPGCMVTSWSPDGSMLAVTFGGTEIFILDQQANVIQTITLDIPYPSFVSQLSWISSDDLIFIDVLRDKDDSRNTQYEIQMVSLDEPTQEHILYRSPTILGIVDSTVNPSRLIISDNRHYPERKFTWFVINTETKKVEQTWEMCNLHGVVSEGLQKDYIALYRKPIEPGNEEICEDDDETFLWIYDWETGELLNYGKIDRLFGWNTKYGGFIVSEDVDADADERTVVIVKP
jgi:hypothetical protein